MVKPEKHLMLRKVFHGFCQNRSGRFVVAGAIGLLTGIERLLASHTNQQVLARPLPRQTPGSPKPVDRFAIRRTQSELGYVYWVVQGFGKHQGFALFDTWREAMDEANRRLGSSALPGSSSEELLFTSEFRR